MKRSWLGGVSVFALIAVGSANAADLTVRAPRFVAPVWSWTGLYGGLHSGVGFGNAEFSNSYGDFGATIYGNDVPTPAALVGGQIGYNYQVGRWIAGIEADASWLSSDGTNTCFAVSGLFLSSTCHVKPNFLGNLTVRLGIAAGPEGRTLLYGKAGLAVIHEDINVTRNIGRKIKAQRLFSLSASTLALR
jgi:opacity protein-like surface antigen